MPAGEPAPLVRAQAARPLDVGRAARDAEELLRVVSAPHRETARRLGAHRFRGTHEMRVTENAGGTVREVEALDEKTRLDVAASGELHALYENSRHYGREIVYAGGSIYTRPRWGKFHRRPPARDDEPLEAADEVYGALGADFELVAHAARVVDGGETSVRGRRARRVTVELGPARARPREKLAQRKWRESLRVTQLEGELVLDAETGAVLSGRLFGEASFVQGDKTFTMSLRAAHEIEEVGGAVTVAPPSPEETADTPSRSRELEERERLLDGLWPTGRTQP